MLRYVLASLALFVILFLPAVGDEVTYWNDVALDLLKTEATHPPKVARDMAIMHVAVFDAVNVVDGAYTPIYSNLASPGITSVEAAIASASHEALTGLYPSRSAELDQALADRLAAIPSGTAKTNGLALGQLSAQAVLAWRADDGWDATISYTPIFDPGHWRPTPPDYKPALAPQWGDVTPFSIPSSDAFVPPPHPTLDSSKYAEDWQIVRDLGGTVSALRTPDQEQIAEFWNDFPGNTAAPPGKWNLIAGILADQQGNTLIENTRMFALLNLAMADAGIVCWDTKFTYDLWRPEDAIHLADQDGNPATTADPGWVPLWSSPNFPEYTSGHSTFSGAAAETLRQFFGTDDISFSTPAGGDVLPGVERSFSSLSEAAEEAGMSRIYGGIHFPSANVYGLSCGEHVAGFVYENVAQPVPEPGSAIGMLAIGVLGMLPRRKKKLSGVLYRKP